MDNIKDYRDKELKSYFIGNILILLFSSPRLKYLFFLINLTEQSDTIVNVVLEIILAIISTGIISSIIFIYLFILDSIVSAKIKTFICNLWRKQPGEVIFDKIFKKNIDKRFIKEDVIKNYASIYGKFSGLDKKQKCLVSNSEWYSIYKEHKDENMIFTSNRDYLLCRDLCFSTFCIICAYILLVIFNYLDFSCKFIIFLALEFIFTNIATRSKSWRFALNVIAADIEK